MISYEVFTLLLIEQGASKVEKVVLRVWPTTSNNFTGRAVIWTNRRETFPGTVRFALPRHDVTPS